MTNFQNLEYPRTYRVSIIIRALFVLLWAMASPILYAIFFVSPDASTISARTEIALFVFAGVCITLYIFMRRVILFPDAVEIRNMFVNRKYLRAQIRGIFRNKTLFFNNGQPPLNIPLNIHPDAAYSEWFFSLPVVTPNGMVLKIKASDSKKTFDAIDNLSKILGVSRPIAWFVLILFSLGLPFIVLKSLVSQR